MAASPTEGPWRLVWLAGLSAGLAWIVHVFTGSGTLEPRAPFGTADAWASEIPQRDLARLGTSADLIRVPAGRGKPFMERAMIGLNGVADRINSLRRLAAGGLAPLAMEDAAMLGVRFSAEVEAFDRYALEFEAEGIATLDVRVPVLIDLGDRGLQLNLGRWRGSELGLPPVDFASRSDVEALHEALNEAYYELVAEYRELKRMRAKL